MLKHNTLKQAIAADLEQAFSQMGFANPSVAQLKDACNVSLRTLYKHYPSKEAMVIAALEHRHVRYLEFLSQDSGSQDIHQQGVEALQATFSKLAHWMSTNAPHGCMSTSAVAAFPDHNEINQVVMKHKLEVRDRLGQLSQRADLATQFFLLHEGIAAAWPVLGQTAVVEANHALTIFMES
ncbi:TetR/AcrR family transcriptional regulator [Vibrio hippocampi]|uniref:HTH tetR-type domain-containing protein n=1 Tax=Vibrio hippocampi TaxID=654686 RepID=A0ABN8DP81_9VIBR|nr:TetR/AcrR family transcriptional regulator [Vibrio hippocampi]CAH0530313.1 hypothetical protein VHP8226_03954 [Vibrio hippocampi]